MTRDVRIRPLLESDLELLAQLDSDPGDEYSFYGYREPGRLRRDFSENGFLGTDRGRLAVALGEPDEIGEFIGDVSWHRAQRGPTSHGWNIGISLLPAARGHGYGTVAQRLLAEYLLTHTQVNRIEAETETGNRAERRSLEKAGFSHEGTVRGSCYRAGKWRDMESYSILRSDLLG